MPTRWLERVARAMARLPRDTKVSIAFTADAVAIPLTLFVAIALRRGSIADSTGVDPTLYVFATLAALATFALLGLYRAVFRYISHVALVRAAFGVLVGCTIVAVFNSAALDREVSLNALVIFASLLLLYLIGSRLFVREILHYTRGTKKRVAIYGAGAAGAQLVRALRETGTYKPVAFIDEDVMLHGTLVNGIKVYAPRVLSALVKRKRIATVLLAVPSCSRRQRQGILKSLESLPVHVRTVPEIGDILSGKAAIGDLREVDADDLLGRDAVAPNVKLLEACIREKAVLVTGAGGSIGSELCRQILRSGPARLLLLEISEAALYQIEREMRSLAKSIRREDVEIVPLLGNVSQGERMRDIMRTYGVQTVYHAAAYKHVPIVEHNVMEGIRNNVLGTLAVAQAAIECGAETFVLISTDKAVNPTNVMGASKRFAELILQALQAGAATRLCMVRFGNVLESSGSVVPLFREQIRNGGPVTVTHKDIIRYFMTIPEASQLVLQAGAMAQGGDVFVLDMGQPVRIVDLAKRMINLMGATVRDEENPNGDIEIQFIGLRPAEKLYEELLIGENVTGTEHPMIMRATEHHIPWAQLKDTLSELVRALDSLDCSRARELLTETVMEYEPVSPLQDLVWVRNHETERERANVTDLRARRLRVVKEPAVRPNAG